MERYSKEEDAFFNAIRNIEDANSNNSSNLEQSGIERLFSQPSKTPEHIFDNSIRSDFSEDINPIKLKNYLVDNYKADWLEWMPEVTDKTVLGDRPSEILSNKIQAIRICLNTDTPWLQWHIFENVGKSFNHQVPDFTRIQPLTLGECLTTVATMKQLRPEEELSLEVLTYIGSVAANNNYVYIPEEWVIGKAQPILRRLTEDFNNWAFIEMVSYQWERLKNKNLLKATFSEDSNVHRQLAKLAIVQQYYREFVA